MVRKNTYDMPPVEMDSPEYEIVSGDDSLAHTGRSRLWSHRGISQKQFRKMIVCDSGLLPGWKTRAG
jgi:hypothetical protein